MKFAWVIVVSCLTASGSFGVVRAQEENPEAPPAEPAVVEEQDGEERDRAEGESPESETPVRPEMPAPEPEEDAPDEPPPQRERDRPTRVEEPPVTDKMIDEAPTPPASAAPREDLPTRRDGGPSQARPSRETLRDRDSTRPGEFGGSAARPAAREARQTRPTGRPNANTPGPTPASGSDYLAFRIITERNIFDASRSSRAARPRDDARRPRQPPETFTLVGTLSYEDVAYAFFDGSRSDYKQVLQVGGRIAGYTLREIGSNSIKLESESGSLELRIGSRVQRTGEAWEMVTNTIPPPPAESESSGSPSSDSSDGESDIIKRLMQKRAQEIQR